MTQHPYCSFRTVVDRVTPLSPSFTRITLRGDELAHFGTDGLDQRIKVIVPFADGTVTDFGQHDASLGMGEWYRTWRLLPDEQRNPIRTYTIRAVRPDQREIDIDFVLHGTVGPASAWASSAAVGDALTVVGPNARSVTDPGGIEWRPGTATKVLIAGDETAAPAICAIAESLPAHVTGDVFVEVPSSEDVLDIAAPAGVRVSWLGRDGREHGSRLTEAVRGWGRTLAPRAAAGADAAGAEPADAEADTVDIEAPASDDDLPWEAPASVTSHEYAWLAGEAGTVTALRRHLVRDLGLDRSSIAFMGYWRMGRAES